MKNSLASRLMVLPKRRQISDLAQQFISSEAHSPKQTWRKPSPSDVLRFALTGSTEPSHHPHPRRNYHGHLSELFQTEWASITPPPALWSSLKRNLPEEDDELVQALEEEVKDVSTLSRVIQRHVNDARQGILLQRQNCSLIDEILRRCEKDSSSAEVILVLYDIIARLQRLEVPISPHLYTIGMRFAMMTLSVPALRRFLNSHHSVGSPLLSANASSAIFEACLTAVRGAIFEDPKYDPKLMLAAITGEEESSLPSGPKLHDIVDLTETVKGSEALRPYLSCLARLQSEETLHSVWSIALEELPKNAVHLYHVVLHLIQSGRSQTALKFLTDISQRCDNSLPKIWTFPRKHWLLHDAIVSEALPDLVKGQDYLNLLGSALRDIERGLGIIWDANGEFHYSEGHDAWWNMSQDRPLLTIDGDCAGFDNSLPLLEGIRTYSDSTSPADLGRIVDLLNTHDGHSYQYEAFALIRLVLPPKDPGNLKPLSVRWRPQHSPIEFSNSRPPISYDPSRRWTPSALGLIRAREMVNSVPQSGPGTLHLMQLGSLEVQYEHDTWEPTAYILAWDRFGRRMICLNVGKNNGVIDPGPSNPSCAFNPTTIVLPPFREGLSSRKSEMYPKLSVRCETFYLDVDPSPDLGF